MKKSFLFWLLAVAASIAFADIETATSESAVMRLDLRSAESLGHAVVTGTETKGTPDGSSSASWDTTALADGWQSVSDGGETANVLVRNGSSVAVEGGRLSASTTWDSSKIHLVRHWVVVPDGVTLAISAGTFVKFCEGTGILVQGGGKLALNGALDAEAVFASAANDAEGGDTDMRTSAPSSGDYDLVVQSGGTLTDTGYTANVNANLGFLPWVTVQDVVVSEASGKAYIPVTVEGSRSLPFSLDWTTADGTARVGSDYVASSGTLKWNGTSDGTKWIEVPLVVDGLDEGWESLKINVTRLRGVNVTTNEAVVSVFDAPVHSGSADSTLSRLDLRPAESLGHSVVTGIETKGTPDGTASAAWDTTALADGWQSVADGGEMANVLVRNGSSVAVDGGRLSASTTWDSSKIHLVRHWVVVPDGVTLAISAGTFVKFCEGTGILVQGGGKLALNGTLDAEVVFASAANDAEGGDTDLRAATPHAGDYDLMVQSGGTLMDTGYTANVNANLGILPWVTVQDVVVSEASGRAFIPVTVSGSRSLPFTLDWTTSDGTAKAGPDFTATSGTLKWNGTSDGTKWLEVPIAVDGVEEGWENLKISVTRLRGLNVSNETATVSLYDKRLDDGGGIVIGYGSNDCIRLNTDMPIVATRGEQFELRVSPNGWNPDMSPTKAATVQCDGTVVGTATEDGVLTWTASNAGCRELRHIAEGTIETNGATLAVKDEVSQQIHVLDDNTVLVYGETISDSTLWTSGTVHVVRGTVTVASDASLTIERGAVVKFWPKAALSVASGGSCTALGAIFTHLYDDTIGGDTLDDGDATKPVTGEYQVTGNVTDDDTTEYRYTEQVVSGGTITSNTRWRGHKVYHVTGNITVGSGATLEIAAGAIVKFNTGLSLTVNSGATLNAIGTRGAPIIFTSIKDDDHGGDTNGDGNKTYAQAGDWTYITGSGALNFEHCEVLWCSSQNNAGGLYVNGGTWQFNNSLVAHCAYDCVRSYGGTFTAENSIFMDASIGAAPSGGSVTFNNCVFYSLTTAVRWGSGRFCNCIFSLVTKDILDPSMSGAASQFSYCCFWSPEATGDKAASKIGRDGNIWGNPIFENPDNGNFRIAGNSPCVDAGDGTVAPETDFYGRPRMDVVKVENTGTANADGVCPDIGIFECDGTTAVEPADLAVLSVAISSTGGSPVQDGDGNAPAGRCTMGDTITVTYVVTNCGSSVNASWRDVVKLVSEYGSEVEIASVMSAAKLGKGEGAMRFEHVVRIPAVSEGDWRVKVDVNPFRDVYERSDTDNNSATSEETIIVTMASAALDAESTGSVTSASPFVKKFTVPDGGAYALRIAAPNGATVSYGIGAMPSSGGACFVATVAADGYAYVSLPAGSTVYVEVSGDKSGSVTMTPFESDMTVLSVSPSTLPQSGEVTLKVAGLHFDSGCTVSLKESGRDVLVASESVRVESSESLTAKFDCSKLASGTTYDLVVATDAGGSQSSATATLPSAVTVSGVKGAAKLEAKLDMPSSLRAGRSFVFYIDYANTGNADMPAPIFTVKSDEMTFYTDYTTYTNSVKVIGLGAEGSAGVIKPGESFRMAVKARVKPTATGGVSYTLFSAWTGGSGADKRLPLASFFSDDYVYWHGEDEQEEYDAIFGKMGTTWSDFYRNLGSYLTHLDGYGLATTDYEQMTQDFAWHCVNEAKGGESTDTAKENSLSDVRAFSSNMGLLSLGAASLDGREEILKSDGELASLENPNSRLWRIPGDAKQLRERTAEHYAILKTDNSEPGDVWVWSGSAWYRLYQPTNGYVSSFFNPSRPSVLICHGNLHSVHTDWVKRMAKAWYQAESGNVNVLAVDWGDDSTELTSWTVLLSKASWGTLAGTLVNTLLNLFTPEQAGWPEKAFGTALDIPNVADAAFTQLQAAGVPSGSLTVVGHSHGGHVGGNICSRYGKGKVKRLVLLEVSSLISHWLLPSSQHFPDSWNESSAQTTEFYKTSYWMSLGSFGGFFSNGSDEIPGMYNFMVIPEKSSRYSNEPSYFEHEWALKLGGHNPNADNGWFGAYFMNGYLKNSDSDNAEGRMEAWRHDNVEEWFIETISKENSGKWKNLGYHWEAKKSCEYFGLPSDLSGKYPKQYHGVINRRPGHEGLELRKPTGWTGEWRYEEQILKNKSDINFTRPMLDYLQDNVTQAIEYRVENPNVPEKIDEKNHKISFTITNAADNLSINYNDVNKKWMASRNEAHAPWQKDKDLGVGVWLCRPDADSDSEFSSDKEYGINDVLRKNWKFLRIKNKKIESLEAFTLPQQKSIKQYSLSVPMKFHGHAIDTEDGEKFLLLIGAGVSSKGGDTKEPSDYFGDLCQTNNWICKVVTVKPTLNPFITINGNEYDDGDTANILIDENQTSLSLSVGVKLNGIVPQGMKYKWSGTSGTFAKDSLPSTTWGLTVPVEDDAAEFGLSQTLAIEDKGQSIDLRTLSVRVRIVRKQKDPGDPNGGGSSPVPQSCDPNEMVGPEGVGEARYVKPGEKMTYTVFFENKADAKAPAQFVTIDNPLNEWLDWSTFQMEDVGFGLQTDTGLVGMKNGTSDATMTGTNLVVRSEVALDEENGVASWFLRIVTPYGDSEGWPYANDPTGFLPPNDPDTHCGEGYVKYSIYVRDDAPKYVVITNSATIVFDYNDPIETDPAWWNTVAPTSSLITLTPNSTSRGTVSGGGTYKIGATATLKAAAKKGYAFAGWFTDRACTKPLNPKGYDNRNPTVKIVVPAKNTTIYAKFVTAAEAKKALKFSSATKKLAKTPKKATAGKAFSLALGISSASLPTVTAKGLPKGLKINKTTGEITGTPTKPGSFTAAVTVKDAAGNTITQKVKITVEAAAYAKGTFYGTAKPGKKSDPMAYLQFTVGKTGKVSGKVTYKGKAYSFKSTLASCTASKATFAPKVKIGKTTFKPGTVTVKTRKVGGLSLVEAANSKATFAAQKKPNLVKKGKALAKLVGKTFKFTKKTKNSGLTKSADKLTVKLANGDAAKVTGVVNGKKLTALSWVTLVSGKATKGGSAVYTLYVDIIDASLKYERTLVITATVGSGNVKATAAFAK